LRRGSRLAARRIRRKREARRIELERARPAPLASQQHHGHRIAGAQEENFAAVPRYLM
jgi:hypothetical protein